MTDILQITSLKVSTRIGIYEWEQRILQPLLIDITIPLDLRACNNQLENTIDYAALCEYITQNVESSSFSLIETVAEHIASEIKAHFNVKQLSITVSKPTAIKNATNVSISITR